MSDEKTQALRALIEKRRTWGFFAWEISLTLGGLFLALGSFLAAVFQQNFFMIGGALLAVTFPVVISRWGPWSSEESRGAKLGLWWSASVFISVMAGQLFPFLQAYSPWSGTILSLFLMTGTLGAMAVVKRRAYLFWATALLFGTVIGMVLFKLPPALASGGYLLAFGLPFLISRSKAAA